ncbi:carboxymuconolactone decarboxylase family protein [Urechidicola vernalis]|uniref:Alkylhydroperoxidase n=1 Tax=Urechidicola vernalis TaxID=3075600 RepID=A0ABU2Y2B9_9FLAO|nr:alkylhydroperoxidase [Urechidicola sp. P050]MDT0552336.1 alkylhydroperoxidase [Urechidicola sp. P050]
MTWIKTIPFQEATGRLLKLYKKVTGPNNNVDNIMMAHSLRPHTMTGHMALYKNVLHNSNNTLPKWYLESIGVYVSLLNNCPYCIDHHFAGLTRLLNDKEKALTLKKGLEINKFNELLEVKFVEGLKYAKKLTQLKEKVSESDILLLKTLNLTDGEILEINQVTAYFNYANRTVLGLGISSEGDIIGLSPNDSADEDNWNHQ